MLPPDLIDASRIECQFVAASKKRVLERLGELLASAESGLLPLAVFDGLLARERLGSTGLGHGIALPHARIAGVARPYGALLQLQEGVDFDAIDNQPVDLAFALLVPEAATEEHLRLLAELAALFSDREFCDFLRNARSPDAVLARLYQPPLAGSHGYA